MKMLSNSSRRAGTINAVVEEDITYVESFSYVLCMTHLIIWMYIMLYSNHLILLLILHLLQAWTLCSPLIWPSVPVSCDVAVSPAKIKHQFSDRLSVLLDVVMQAVYFEHVPYAIISYLVSSRYTPSTELMNHVSLACVRLRVLAYCVHVSLP